MVVEREQDQVVEYGYLVQRENDWIQIYFVDGYTVGFISATELEVN